MTKDYNFDQLASRFQNKVYGGLKGQIRIAVLERDFNEFFPKALTPAGERPLQVLDAGGGFGPFSILLAQKGHRVTICDLSEKMLKMAQERFEAQGVAHTLSICHCPVQELDCEIDGQFDIVLCHGVLGWVNLPVPFISRIMNLMAANGILSLSFYNLNGMIFKNLLRTNYKKILKQAYTGYPGSLTPVWPRTADQVTQWLLDHPFEILCRSGIRIFHDYILDPVDRERDPENQVRLELEFSRQSPFRDLGRYLHILGKKTTQGHTSSNVSFAHLK